MKIKITESQLKIIIEKYQQNQNLNEGWIDDVVDFIKTSFGSSTTKTKEILKNLTKDNKKDVSQPKNEKGGTTVVIGGMSYATGSWMKSEWVKAGLPTTNVEFINYTEGSKLKQIKETKDVKKIMGFSAGGKLVWKEIDNNPEDYSFIGLIDPTSPKVYSSLPNNVYSMSNSANWGTYPKLKSNLQTMEKSGVLDKTSKPHKDIPYEFFQKYKSKLK